MSKYRFKTTGDFNQICRYIKDEILNTSASASLEEEDYIMTSDSRIGILNFERYSYSGGNRLSLNVTIVENNHEITIIGMSSGGSNGVFFKFNPWGEDAFLDKLIEALDKLK